MGKRIQVTCEAAALVAPQKLTIIQGNLKSLSESAYGKLRDEIASQGFSFAIHVWKAPDGKLCILDGTQRIRTVTKMCTDEGYTCPKVPVAFVEADNLKHAVRKLLAGAGMYGKPEKEGLYELLQLSELSLDDVPNIELPGISLPKFRKEFYDDPDEEGMPGRLLDRFVVPPFSILDTRKGYWVERKAKWMQAIGDEGDSRKGKLAAEGTLLADINDGVSILDPVLAECMVRWFSPPAPCKILDPFAGDTVFGYVAKYLGQDFTGFELRKEQARLNQQRCDRLTRHGTAKYKHGTAQSLAPKLKPESLDLVFSCPPYYDLEKYSDDPMDLSNLPTFGQFMSVMESIMEPVVAALKPNRFLVMVLGDVRCRKNGHYHGLVPKMIEMLTSRSIPLQFYNDLVLLNAVGTAPQRAGRAMNNRKVVKLHQNVLVFYKGATKAIKDHFPKLEEDAALLGDN